MAMRKNILFVIPRYETYGMEGHYVMPMGTLYVSAYVKEANVANVFTLNLNHIEGDETSILRENIFSHDIDVITIGGLSGEYSDIARMTRIAKQIKKDLLVVVAGGIITADPVVAMQALEHADIGIVGEGEQTNVELLKALAEGAPLSNVNGLVYKDGDQIITTTRREEIFDLDTLPFPDYLSFDYDQYLLRNPDLSDEGQKYSQVSVIGGRSCKYNCTFCFHPSGSRYRQRSLDSIFSEIDFLTAHYPISYIALREELFATDNRRVAEFCKRMESRDFDWSIQLRIDSINEKLVELLRNTRCRYLFVGIESACDEVLRSMRKGINLKQIEYALDLLHDAGLNSRSGLIFGDAAETYESAMFSLDWYERNKSKYRMFVDMIISFPGSALYKNACASGVIPDPVRFLREGCPIVNVSRMSDEEFLALTRQIEQINGRKYNVRFYRE